MEAWIVELTRNSEHSKYGLEYSLLSIWCSREGRNELAV
jgi:hypothetical protein